MYNIKVLNTFIIFMNINYLKSLNMVQDETKTQQFYFHH
jgi:hypothetical protein